MHNNWLVFSGDKVTIQLSRFQHEPGLRLNVRVECSLVIGLSGCFSHSRLSKFFQALVKSHLPHLSVPAGTTSLKVQRVLHVNKAFAFAVG